MKEFAAELSKLISSCEYDQGYIAEKLGIAPSFLSDLKLGRRDPTPSVVNEVAKFFRLSKIDKDELHKLAARDRGFEV